MLESAVRLKDGHAQCTSNNTRSRYSTWNRKKTTLFSRHYLRNRSTSDIGVWVRSVYFNVRNILPKSGTFHPGHPVYYTKTDLEDVRPSLQQKGPTGKAQPGRTVQLSKRRELMSPERMPVHNRNVLRLVCSISSPHGSTNKQQMTV